MAIVVPPSPQNIDQAYQIGANQALTKYANLDQVLRAAEQRSWQAALQKAQTALDLLSKAYQGMIHPAMVEPVNQFVATSMPDPIKANVAPLDPQTLQQIMKNAYQGAAAAGYINTGPNTGQQGSTQGNP